MSWPWSAPAWPTSAPTWPNLRTGLSLVIAGLSLINFFHDYVFIWIGTFFIPFVLGVIGLGGVRFRTRSRRIAAAVAARQRRSAARSTT